MKALEVGGVKATLIIDGLSKTKLTVTAMDELKTTMQKKQK